MFNTASTSTSEETMNTNPNEWSCLPTAAANTIGQPVEEIIRLLGHDGSDLPYEGDYSDYRAGFHVDELIDVLDRLGWSVTPFQYAPCMVPQPEAPPRMIFEDNDTRFFHHLKRSKGFIIGYLKLDEEIIGHAVTNDNEKITDPRGRNSSYMAQDMHLFSFIPTVYFKVTRK
jgi:hypothetical protein